VRTENCCGVHIWHGDAGRAFPREPARFWRPSNRVNPLHRAEGRPRSRVDALNEIFTLFPKSQTSLIHAGPRHHYCRGSGADHYNARASREGSTWSKWHIIRGRHHCAARSDLSPVRRARGSQFPARLSPSSEGTASVPDEDIQRTPIAPQLDNRDLDHPFRDPHVMCITTPINFFHGTHPEQVASSQIGEEGIYSVIKLGQACLDIARQELTTILHHKESFIRYCE